MKTLTMSAAPTPPSGTASVTSVIHAQLEVVWAALTDAGLGWRPTPDSRREGTWTEGGTITWSGERERKPFQETAKVLQLREPELLKYDHRVENGPGHTVTIELREVAGITHLRVTGTGYGADTERTRAEAEWNRMLDELKKGLGEAPTPEPEVQRT